MMFYKAVFKLLQKWHLQIYASQFMTSETIRLSFVYLNLESVERKWKNYKSLNISRTKRAFLMKQNTFFKVFEGPSFNKFNKNQRIQVLKDSKCVAVNTWKILNNSNLNNHINCS